MRSKLGLLRRVPRHHERSQRGFRSTAVLECEGSAVTSAGQLLLRLRNRGRGSGRRRALTRRCRARTCRHATRGEERHQHAHDRRRSNGGSLHSRDSIRVKQATKGRPTPLRSNGESTSGQSSSCLGNSRRATPLRSLASSASLAGRRAIPTTTGPGHHSKLSSGARCGSRPCPSGTGRPGSKFEPGTLSHPPADNARLAPSIKPRNALNFAELTQGVARPAASTTSTSRMLCPPKSASSVVQL